MFSECTKRLGIGCLALAMASASGCSSFSLTSSDPFKKMVVVSEKRPVERIVAMWEPADGTDDQNRSTRGFNGRIMFFTAGGKGSDSLLQPSKKPTMSRPSARIQPGDEVSIFVFDDFGNAEEQIRPLSEYKFTGEEFETFLAMTNLGGEHDLFIPYKRPGAYAAKCAVRVKYVPENGKAVFSELVAVEVPGTPRPVAQRPAMSQAYNDTNFQQAAHAQAAPQRRAEPVARETLSLPANLNGFNPQLQDDQSRLNARIQEFVKDYKQQQVPEYKPSYRVTKSTIDPRDTANVIDLRNPQGEAQQRPAFPEQSPPTTQRHPLLDD